MHLIQLPKEQLSSLNQTVTKLNQYNFLEGAIPPDHVLHRSLLNSKSGICDWWALPYFMVEGDQILGSCGFKKASINGAVEIGYHVAAESRGKVAVRFLCEKADGVDTVQALILSQNKASLNVVRKNVFSYIRDVLDEENELLG